MILKHALSILVVFSLAFSCVANADLPAKAVEIMNVTKGVNGYVDKENHDQFWAEIKKYVSPDPAGKKLGEVESSLQAMMISSIAFPTEGWRSAKLSLEQHKVVRTPELLRQTEIMRARGIPNFEASVASTDKLLEAAATGKPLSHGGQTMYVDDELISQVLGGMDATLSRVKVLTNPVWTNTMEEQSINEMGLAVLSHDSFVVTRIKDQAARGYMAARYTGVVQEQILTINFADKPGTNLDKAALNALTGAVAALGLKAKPTPTYWRGLEGVTAVMPLEINGGKSGVAIQAVKRPNSHSVLIVIAMSDGSPADAALALDSLLKRIKLK